MFTQYNQYKTYIEAVLYVSAFCFPLDLGWWYQLISCPEVDAFMTELECEMDKQ